MLALARRLLFVSPGIIARLGEASHKECPPHDQGGAITIELRYTTRELIEIHLAYTVRTIFIYHRTCGSRKMDVTRVF